MTPTRPGRPRAAPSWRRRPWLTLIPVIALAGCAATTTAQDPHPANTWLKARVSEAPALPWPASAPDSADAHQARSQAHPLPDGPLGQDQAVTLSLQRSPALVALLARSEAQAARERSQARPGFLGFSIERLTQGDEVEIGRTWSLGLFDLLSWPWPRLSGRPSPPAKPWCACWASIAQKPPGCNCPIGCRRCPKHRPGPPRPSKTRPANAGSTCAWPNRAGRPPNPADAMARHAASSTWKPPTGATPPTKHP